MNDKTDFWFWLNVVANFCQLENYNMNVRQINNNDFLKDIINQNNVIIKQNEEIIKLLEKR